MSVAKKSLIALGFVILTVMGVSFVAAKISHKKISQKISPKTEVGEALTSHTKKPFFYTSVGSSNPDAAVVKTAQSVAKFTVNVRTFRTKVEAEKLLTQLNAAGFFGYYTPVRQGAQVVYHVRLGIYSDEREASKTLGVLQKKTSFQGSVAQLQ